jgi:hypothetical protein
MIRYFEGDYEYTLAEDVIFTDVTSGEEFRTPLGITDIGRRHAPRRTTTHEPERWLPASIRPARFWRSIRKEFVRATRLLATRY